MLTGRASKALHKLSWELLGLLGDNWGYQQSLCTTRPRQSAGLGLLGRDAACTRAKGGEVLWV